MMREWLYTASNRDELGCTSPLTSRFPSALGTSLGPQEISWSSGMYNPIHPSSRQCTYTILLSRSAGPVVLTGSSLLNLLNDQKTEVEGTNLIGGEQSNPVSRDSHRLVFGSHVLHEATMYYPMRSLRSARSLYITPLFSFMPSNSTKN